MVGVGTTPDTRDHMMSPVDGRRAQYAFCPVSVTPAAPSTSQSAPTSTTGTAGTGGCWCDGLVLVTPGEDERRTGPGNQQRDQNRGGYRQRALPALRFVSVTTRGRDRGVVDTKIIDRDIGCRARALAKSMHVS